MIAFVEGGLDHPAVAALLGEHLRQMHANSPPGSVYALDTSGLAASDIRFVTAWDGDRLLGCGALRRLSPDHGEVKSMRTATDALRRGVGAAILAHLLDRARAEGMAQVSLETGTGPAFDAAHALYRRFGFALCPPFGDYRATDFNRFLSLRL